MGVTWEDDFLKCVNFRPEMTTAWLVCVAGQGSDRLRPSSSPGLLPPHYCVRVVSLFKAIFLSFLLHLRDTANRQAVSFQQAPTQDLNNTVQYLESKFVIQIVEQNFQT